ncbi:MAG: hypothetical protein HY816_19185 [Candidatus Wallbacteria bacterium]|nr:hypothetical protein [Candidatus Wallbacteria bacterium]
MLGAKRGCLGALLLVAATLAATDSGLAQEPGAIPQETQQLQLDYVKNVSAELETVVKGMSDELFESDPFFSSKAAVHPDGKLAALALSREQAGENRWSVLLLNKTTLEVTQVYDFIRAHHLNRLEWSPDGSSLLVLSEDVALSGPPGSLSVVDTRAKRAFVLDRGVWQYSLSSDGSELVYERCADVSQPYGKREIYHTSFAKLLAALADRGAAENLAPKQQAAQLRERTTARVMVLDYPREQLEGFKSWSADGKVLHFATYRYAPGAQAPSIVRHTLDLPSGRVAEVK